MKMEQCSEMSAYKIQAPGNYPEESIQLCVCLFLLDCLLSTWPSLLQIVLNGTVLSTYLTKCSFQKFLKL